VARLCLRDDRGCKCMVANSIAVAVLVICVVLAAGYLIRRRRNAKKSGSCGCVGCSGCSSCAQDYGEEK
jgi:hypothetical protein